MRARRRFVPQVESATLEERVPLAGNLAIDDLGTVTVHPGDHISIQAHYHELVHYPALNVWFKLEPGAPLGSVINATTGVFQWDAGSPGTYYVGVRVLDDGDKATGLTTSTDVGTLTIRVVAASTPPSMVPPGTSLPPSPAPTPTVPPPALDQGPPIFYVRNRRALRNLVVHHRRMYRYLVQHHYRIVIAHGR